MVGGSESDRCRQARQWGSLRLDGELSELERLLLRRHLNRCEECRTFVDGLEAIARTVRATPLEQLDRPLAPAAPPPTKKAPRRVRLVAATAVVVVAAGVGAVVGAVIGSSGKQPVQSPPVQTIVQVPDNGPHPTTGNI
jgi:anti-sigma factor RsiW